MTYQLWSTVRDVWWSFWLPSSFMDWKEPITSFRSKNKIFSRRTSVFIGAHARCHCFNILLVYGLFVMRSQYDLPHCLWFVHFFCLFLISPFLLPIPSHDYIQSDNMLPICCDSKKSICFCFRFIHSHQSPLGESIKSSHSFTRFHTYSSYIQLIRFFLRSDSFIITIPRQESPYNLVTH